MKNPLNKRLPRELRSELGKYLVVFLLLIGSIGFVSGFLVADNSLLIAYGESFEKYQIEDGHFRTAGQLDKTQLTAIEEQGVTLYENFYVEEDVSNGSTLRIFANRTEVNRVCLMEGDLPDADNEIAIDRMYADNNGIAAGDTLSVGGRELTVSGLVALSDYSALFADNNDSMFDSVKFGVSVMTEEGVSLFSQTHLRYSYSWLYNNAPANVSEEKEQSERLMKKIGTTAALEDFVPRYLNQSIQFTGEDMGGDKSMIITLLYIIIVILAFVFGITISNTISKEACVIGTLRASGYTKGELIRHYMAMPLLVTVIGAVLGNLLGYTVFKDICAGMYYGSYSLPSYETVWNAEAFLLTTAVPLILMLIINLAILARKLSLSPLKFIRRDLKKKTRRKAIRLNKRIGFFSRFRIRIILQNTGNYATLFVGILFANLLLMFGLILPAVLDDFQQEITDHMLCEYQYLLKVPEIEDDGSEQTQLLLEQVKRSLDTDEAGAEKFSAYSLNTLEGKYRSERISLYGVAADSHFVPVDFTRPGVYVSEGYAEKFGVKAGDTITLKERYADKEYTFEVAGTYDYPGALSVFMEQGEFNRRFGYAEEYFNGYFSDSELTDIDDAYIASVIDEEDLTKLSRQLTVSMGSMMDMVCAFAVVMFLILIYLLSKIIIEKNAQSISMVKILGYTNKDVSRLYILSTAILVVLFLLISLPIEYLIMKFLFLTIMMTSITGWITFSVSPVIYGEMFALGVAAYAVVAALEYRKIQRIPLSEALKNGE